MQASLLDANTPSFERLNIMHKGVMSLTCTKTTNVA
jgi:hypothetical protein